MLIHLFTAKVKKGKYFPTSDIFLQPRSVMSKEKEVVLLKSEVFFMT